MTIRVLLADDHPAVRAGIRGELEKAADMEVVGEAGDGEKALR
ncbi:MAG: DNA-binding response regulator, partial [Chloroflexi bacterium]